MTYAALVGDVGIYFAVLWLELLQILAWTEVDCELSRWTSAWIVMNMKIAGKYLLLESTLHILAVWPLFLFQTYFFFWVGDNLSLLLVHTYTSSVLF